MTNVGAMTHFALAILALASGVYTYLGVRSLLDGSASQIFFAAIVYASAVSVGIYVFWAYLMRFFPLIIERSGRLALIGVMIVGGGMIIAMSSWLNAAALAGSAALEQHLAVTLEEYAGDLDAAHGRALSAESLLPDVQRASERFSRLAEDERSNGALTGTSGSGSVVQLLGQMGAQLDELGDAIRNSRTQTETLFEKGRAHLSAMRTLVSAPGPVQPRADRYAEEAVTLSGVIAALQETSIAPSVKRAAEDLSIGFIAPIADGLDANLAARQSQIMATVESSVEAQSQALAQAADEIMAEPRVASRRFQPLSSAEAVIRYASDFAPSWAGAISIDLLPAMLVFMLAIAQNVSMREGAIQADAETMSAADMMRALAVYREMSSLEGQADANLEVTKSAPDEPPAEQDEPVLKNSVTPISSIVKK
ncbi:hypothetical protein WNY59_10970 [Ahrensia kielensis]|uniref:DUF4407 domain-containing protein n=2 Tax=Ahrensia kielensis TaxID=76980 RepID=A0ABU9T7K2_9HYPH